MLTQKNAKYLFWAHSSTVEHLPLKETVGGSNPPALTKSEIEEAIGAALSVPASAKFGSKPAESGTKKNAKNFKELFNST